MMQAKNSFFYLLDNDGKENGLEIFYSLNIYILYEDKSYKNVRLNGLNFKNKKKDF